MAGLAPLPKPAAASAGGPGAAAPLRKTHGRKLLQLALAASLGAHGLAAYLAVHGFTPSTQARDATSRQKTIAVNLTRQAPVLAPAMASIPIPVQSTAVPMRPRVATIPSKAARVAAVPLPSPALPTPTGAPHVSLFAQITSQPLGRGQWGHQPRASQSPPPPDAQALREQAALAWRMSLQQRLNGLAENLRLNGIRLDCEIGIHSERRSAQVHCSHEPDHALAWSVLQGIVTAEVDANALPDLCLRLDAPQPMLAPCPSAVLAGPATGT
jgi:hypothetical protein